MPCQDLGLERNDPRLGHHSLRAREVPGTRKNHLRIASAKNAIMEAAWTISSAAKQVLQDQPHEHAEEQEVDASDDGAG